MIHCISFHFPNETQDRPQTILFLSLHRKAQNLAVLFSPALTVFHTNILTKMDGKFAADDVLQNSDDCVKGSRWIRRRRDERFPEKTTGMSFLSPSDRMEYSG